MIYESIQFFQNLRQQTSASSLLRELSISSGMMLFRFLFL